MLQALLINEGKQIMARVGRPSQPPPSVDIDPAWQEKLSRLAFLSIYFLRELKDGKIEMKEFESRLDNAAFEIFDHAEKKSEKKRQIKRGRLPSFQMALRHLIIRNEVRCGGTIEGSYRWINHSPRKPLDGYIQIHPVSEETKRNFWREEKLLSEEISMLEFFEFMLQEWDKYPHEEFLRLIQR